MQVNEAVRVRVAEPSDADAIRALLLEVFVGEGYAQEAHTDRLLGNVAPLLATGGLLVSTREDRIVGTATVLVPGNEGRHVAGDDEGEIRLVAVSPKARGLGVGAALMAACLDQARKNGLAGVALSTQPTMTSAHRLYERLSFQRAPERDYTTRNGLNMLVYALALGS